MIHSNSRWHLAALVALVALLLVVLNRSAERDPELLGLRLEGDVAAESAEASTLDLPVPARAEPAGDESGSGAARTALRQRGLIRGRLLVDGAPLARHPVVLLRVAEIPIPTLDTKGRGGKARLRERRKERRFNIQSERRTDRTGDDGVFEFSNLEPGIYVVEIHNYQDRRVMGYGEGLSALPQTGVVMRRIDVEGVHDLGDIEMLRKDFEVQVKSSGPASLEIESGQPGLAVRVYDLGAAGFHNSKGRTDGKGNAELDLRKATAVRIDLVDRNGYVLGSTDGYDSYPLGLATVVRIPAVPGRLAVQLPEDVEVRPDEKVQFTLTRNSSPAEHLIIKSMWGKNLASKRAGVQMSPEGIEFKALRAGTYSVKAMRRIVDADGVLSSPSGGWMLGTAHVYPGQLSTCRLK